MGDAVCLSKLLVIITMGAYTSSASRWRTSSHYTTILLLLLRHHSRQLHRTRVVNVEHCHGHSSYCK